MSVTKRLLNQYYDELRNAREREAPAAVAAALARLQAEPFEEDGAPDIEAQTEPRSESPSPRPEGNCFVAGPTAVSGAPAVNPSAREAADKIPQHPAMPDEDAAENGKDSRKF